MTKRILALALPLALVGSFVASSAQAATILTADAGFYRFGMDAVGDPVVARPAPSGSSVPEPSTMALLAFGLAGFRLATRRSARARRSQI